MNHPIQSNEEETNKKAICFLSAKLVVEEEILNTDQPTR